MDSIPPPPRPSLPAVPWAPPPQLPFPKIGSGKVREIYDLGDALLLVASDRISAFDVILGQGVPGKGIILTQISHMAFAMGRSVIPNHLLPSQDERLERVAQADAGLRWRSMVVRKLRPLPMECVVRGYLAGSAWKAYRATGFVHGIRLPPGLQEGAALPEPIFTPTTKAAAGHDEPLTHAEASALIGSDLFHHAMQASLRLFEAGSRWGARAGLILADTKFEFGTDAAGELHWIDEALTPDSSRWWSVDTYRPGMSPPGFDKQFVRDFLTASGWDYRPPAPDLPPEVVAKTRDLYQQAWERLIRAARG